MSELRVHSTGFGNLLSMAHPHFDLVILDLDGTIYDPAADPCIQPRVEEVVAAVQAAGIPVTLATGRTLDFVRPLVRRLGLRIPVVVAQGAVVGNAGTGEILHESPFPEDTSADLLAWARRARCVVALYVHRAGHPLRVLQNREDDTPEYYDRLFGTPRALLAHESLDPARERVLKFIVVNRPHERDLSRWLRRRFRGTVTVARTHEDLVEGTRPGVDKGAGVAVLLEHLGIAPERVLFVGDNENDLPVFRLVGTSVAMATAPPEVRRRAAWVAPSLEDAGAAVALERFILQP